MGLFHRGNEVLTQTFKELELLQNLMNMNYLMRSIHVLY